MAWFKSGYKQTDTKDRTASFTQAGTRENIRSGEKHKTLFGKIAKYFSDLKPVAFTGSYNDLRDKPSNLAPSSHRHSKSDITDFPSSLPASDVYGWAKAASKPSYTAEEIGAVSNYNGSIGYMLKLYFNTIPGPYIGFDTQYGGLGAEIGGFNRLYIRSGNTTQRGIEITTYDTYEKETVDISPVYSKGVLGSTRKWEQVYAVNGSISTSDRNEKYDISYIGTESGYDTCMTDEQLIKLILGLKPVVFKRINGESARPHHGIIAQDFEELMAEIGLHDHAAFIKSPAVEMKEVETKDKDGNIKHQLAEETIPGEYRYGMRYEEFISDLIRFCQLLKDENNRQQKKIEDLEKRMEILENAVKCS